MTRSSTTAIHHVDVGEGRTSCGIELLHHVMEERELPTLVPRRKSMSDVKIVTTAAYDCGSCARIRARALALADVAADEPRAALDPDRRPARGSAIETAIRDDEGST